MTLGLSMVVKNEACRLDGCLGPVRDLFDDVVVVDTGSSDETVDILRRRYCARVLSLDQPQDDPHAITEARNLSLDENKADWVLVLDADERISRDAASHIKQAMDGNRNAYFLVWRNSRQSETFDDYKLALFRNRLGIEFEGRVHCNPQRSARRLRIDAELLNDIVIEHALDEVTPSRSARKQRLEHYVTKDPTWWRYQWFLGYMYFKERNFEKAVPLLRDTCNSLSLEFPVECLNAHVVLTDINARKQIHDKCYRIMKQAAAFYETVKDDFEVKANKDLGAWIQSARTLIDRNELEKVRTYEFAY